MTNFVPVCLLILERDMKQRATTILLLCLAFGTRAQSEAYLSGSGRGILQLMADNNCKELHYTATVRPAEQSVYTLCGKTTTAMHQLLEYSGAFQHHIHQRGGPGASRNLNVRTTGDTLPDAGKARREIELMASGTDSLHAIVSTYTTGTWDQKGAQERYVGLDFTEMRNENGPRSYTDRKIGAYFTLNIRSVLFPTADSTGTEALKQCFLNPDRDGNALFSCAAADQVTIIEQALLLPSGEPGVHRYTCYVLTGTRAQVDSLQKAIVMSPQSDVIVGQRLRWDLVLVKNSRTVQGKVKTEKGATVIYDLLHGQQYNAVVQGKQQKTLTVTNTGGINRSQLERYVSRVPATAMSVTEAAPSAPVSYAIRKTKERLSVDRASDNSGLVLPPVVLMYLSDDLKPY
ncbi:hypothetical protein B0I18_11542 [Taibaiella chishuiensis]|uniref:Uncharacterized protein n=2 Tax=Taibaiella chishuiensis TaxID=1434707 RepID=A0A2P8CT56_9BACT|nr:hypothetical protein B0I18_11542 [Taibaiella chishuiensis]